MVIYLTRSISTKNFIFFPILTLGKRQVKQSKKMKESSMFSGTENANESIQDISDVGAENSPFSRGSGREKLF